MLHTRVVVDNEEPKVPYETREQIPDVIVTHDALVAYSEKLRQGTGPLALDAERASGYTLVCPPQDFLTPNWRVESLGAKE